MIDRKRGLISVHEDLSGRSLHGAYRGLVLARRAAVDLAHDRALDMPEGAGTLVPVEKGVSPRDDGLGLYHILMPLRRDLVVYYPGEIRLDGDFVYDQAALLAFCDLDGAPVGAAVNEYLPAVREEPQGKGP